MSAKRGSGASNRLAYSGSAAIPSPGVSGMMSATRASGSISEARARSTSVSRCEDSCNAISLPTAMESAGCQGAIAGSNSQNSGAPRPRAPSFTSASQALTPSA